MILPSVYDRVNTFVLVLVACGHVACLVKGPNQGLDL